MSGEIPEVRIAVFGPRGSGKTTLLASYYGNQQLYSFEESHLYKLEAKDASVGLELLEVYHGMEDGHFPQGTEKFKEYIFNLKIKNIPTTAMKIIWYDYPGGWWEREPEDFSELQERNMAFRSLLTSHVGVLLIDSSKYQEKGYKYVQVTISQFKNEIEKIYHALQAEGQDVTQMPSEWIIAFSKADVLPEKKAITLRDAVVVKCADPINAILNLLSEVHKTDSANIGFGKKILLLSSVLADSNTQIKDAKSFIGLQLLAPIALMTYVESLIKKSDTGNKYKYTGRVFEFLSGALDFIDLIEKMLPIKFKVLVKLIKLMSVKDHIDKGADYFRKKQKEAAKDRNSLEAVANAMKSELASDEAKTVYHQES